MHLYKLFTGAYYWKSLILQSSTTLTKCLKLTLSSIHGAVVILTSLHTFSVGVGMVVYCLCIKIFNCIDYFLLKCKPLPIQSLGTNTDEVPNQSCLKNRHIVSNHLSNKQLAGVSIACTSIYIYRVNTTNDRRQQSKCIHDTVRAWAKGWDKFYVVRKGVEFPAYLAIDTSGANKGGL